MTSQACTEPDCGGAVAADGYCDTCGVKASAVVPAPSPPPSPSVPLSVGAACGRDGCTGSISDDGYCDTCGLAASASGRHTTSSHTDGGGSPAPSLAAAMAPSTSARLATTGSSRRQSSSVRTGTVRKQLGAGLVQVVPTPAGDPVQAVMSAEKIASVLGVVDEADRICTSCASEVGRGKDGVPGRVEGFCSTCRTPFDFVTNAPVLTAGDMVAGQYEILGPIAHGGMGWIYLGRDKAVSDRWVVLKGLLNRDDEDAALSAEAERQRLAQIEHGSIVNIYNFVTHAGAGYIVMEYVGGDSLNGKLKDRRKANGGVPDPLPPEQAIAYILGIIPAFGYLHGLGLVYNDLKPANIMVVGDAVKLIDVGAVMRSDDPNAAIFGTRGFQAPEVASMGPSVSSDLFTIGRTLAVLILNFVFHSGDSEYTLPPANAEPLFVKWESLHRFLLKSTAAHPDDRFQTADGMSVQLLAVLREMVAIQQGVARPAPSALFGGDRMASLIAGGDQTASETARPDVLPLPRIDPADPAASFLIDLPDEPNEAVRLLIAAGSTVEASREFRLRQARASIEAGRPAGEVLDSVAGQDPWEWRVSWWRGVEALRTAQYAEAAERFSHVWTELPGELAPKLAIALSAELAKDYDRASTLYDLVLTVDSTYVSAAFGLARCRSAQGDRAGALAAYERVPTSSATYFDAQVASARMLIDNQHGTPAVADLASAASTVERLQLDAAERTRLSAEILENALAANAATSSGGDTITLFGAPLDDEKLRHRLESVYREQARLAETAAERIALVDRANAVRPRTLF